MPHKPFVRTLRAQWLGHELRKLREGRNLTLQLVALHLKRDPSALSRYERGDWPIGRADVLALLDLYGFHQASERDRMLRLAEEVWLTDRWSENYSDIMQPSFIDFPWLESRAAQVRSYHAMLVPGLFQLRPICGPDLAHAQLAHVLACADQDRVTVRVVPTSAGPHTAMHSDFWVFEMPAPYPAVAYLEYLGGQIYLESPKSDRYARAYDGLHKVALGPRESATFVANLLKEWT